MEDNFASWDEKQQVWQIVAKLGVSIQGYQGYLRELIHDGNTASRTFTRGYQWEVLGEILPQHMAKCMKMKTAGTGYRP